MAIIFIAIISIQSHCYVIDNQPNSMFVPQVATPENVFPGLSCAPKGLQHQMNTRNVRKDTDFVVCSVAQSPRRNHFSDLPLWTRSHAMLQEFEMRTCVRLCFVLHKPRRRTDTKIKQNELHRF